MSTRALLIAISAAILGATGYGVISTMDSRTAGDIQKSIKAVMKNPMSLFQQKEEATVIAQKYGGSDPHGDDPHGDDPHDEIHDPKLPANAARSTGKAPKDVYGGDIPNDQAPY